MKPDTKLSKRQDSNCVGGRKREHERHSGSTKTGVKAVDKRKGGGAYNWGNVKDDIKAFNESSSHSSTRESKEENHPHDD